MDSTEDRIEPQEEEGTSSGGGAFSLWGLGASVLGNVQKNTTTLVNTIVETDWKKELQEIQDGLRSETVELEKDIGTKLGIASADNTDSSTRAAPAAAESDGVSAIADIGRRFLTGTAEIFQQVRATVDSEFTNLEQEATKKPRSSLPRAGREGGAKFSRLDMKVSAMQRNSATYCDEPADAEAFAAFLAEYDEEARTAQAAEVLSSNPFMSELHSRLVPLVISDDTFWQRYFFRLQKLTEDYQKVQERLQQAHRRASKQEPDNEPLDSALSGPIGQLDASPVTSPVSARISLQQPDELTPGRASVGNSEQLEAQQSPAARGEETPLSQYDAAQSDPLCHPEDAAAEGTAGHGASPADAAQNGASSADGGEPVEEAPAQASQPREPVADVAVGPAGGDAEEGGSAGSPGNEKMSSDWSVVSPTGNENGSGNGTNTAAGSPLSKAQPQTADLPTQAEEAAAKPAGAELGTPEEHTCDEGEEEQAGAAEEDVDFDDLEDGLENGEGDEEEEVAEGAEDEGLDDNWGWE